MRIHFAGADSNQRYNDLLHRAKAGNRLESFYSLGGKAPSEGFERNLLDSGGFVARTKNIVISVKMYAEFINRWNVKYAFNLDTNDVAETLRNQEFLIKACPGCYIIPIYHMSDWLEGNDLLTRFMAENHPYIAVGGVAGGRKNADTQAMFYNHVFKHTRDKIKVHGLGITSRPMLQRYPWYSVDSTSWLSTARYGNSISTDMHMTKMKAKKRHYLENTEEEVQRWLEVNRQMNLLWSKRGVNWTD